jgi:hypothetical protein
LSGSDRAQAATARNGALQLGSGVWRQCSIFWRAQLLDLLRGLAQLELEAADTVASHRRLDPAYNARALANQVLMLTVWPLGIFLRKGRDRHHAAVFRLATQPAQNSAHEQGGIQPIRFCSPMLARYRNTGRVDHIGLDSSSPQPPRQPKPVAASFERHYHPLDLAVRFDRFASPAMKQRQKRVFIGVLLLQRLPCQSRDKTGNQPALETQFDHCNQRAILFEGDEGSAQIVPLHGTLHQLFCNNDGMPTSSPPP